MQLRIMLESEAGIIVRIAQQHDAARAASAQLGDAPLDQRRADALALDLRGDRNRTKAEPMTRSIADGDCREGDVADYIASNERDQRHHEIAIRAQVIDDVLLVTAAMGPTGESGFGNRMNFRFVAGRFESDGDAHGSK